MDRMTEPAFQRMVTDALAAGLPPITLANELAVSVTTVARWAKGTAVPHPAMREPVRLAIDRIGTGGAPEDRRQSEDA